MDVFLRIYPIAPKTSNGRDSRTDALYNRSSRNSNLGHRGVLCIHDACGNLDVYCSHDDLLDPSHLDVLDIPCPVLSVFAILSVCLFFGRYLTGSIVRDSLR